MHQIIRLESLFYSSSNDLMHIYILIPKMSIKQIDYSYNPCFFASFQSASISSSDISVSFLPSLIECAST